jgi:hypothetical protein
MSRPESKQLRGGPPPAPEPQVGEATPRSKRRNLNQQPLIPAAVCKEITQAARELKRNHRALFIADPMLKDRVARLIRSLLPPKPRRRGRPGRKDVTTAILLLARFRRQYPTERAELHWRRVYPLAIPNYDAMSEIHQFLSPLASEWKPTPCTAAGTPRLTIVNLVA